MQRGCSARLLLILSLIGCLVLSSCAGLSDWEYVLPNDYVVVRVNGSCIDFGKLDENGSSIEIDRYIIEFCYNESFIGLKRFPLPFNPNENPEREKAFFGSDPNHLEYNYKESDLEYYLVNAFADEIYGPYTAAEYNEKCKDLGVGEMCDWINTASNPNNYDHKE